MSYVLARCQPMRKYVTFVKFSLIGWNLAYMVLELENTPMIQETGIIFIDRSLVQHKKTRYVN